MAFIRLSKDTTWTYVDTGVKTNQDVLCIENKIYAVDCRSKLFSFDITTQSQSDLKCVAEGVKPVGFMLKY